MIESLSVLPLASERHLPCFLDCPAGLQIGITASGAIVLIGADKMHVIGKSHLQDPQNLNWVIYELEDAILDSQAMGLDHHIEFGKYRDWTVREVLEHDPSYLVWAHCNVKVFSIKQSIYTVAYQEVYPITHPRFNESAPEQFDEEYVF